MVFDDLWQEFFLAHPDQAMESTRWEVGPEGLITYIRLWGVAIALSWGVDTRLLNGEEATALAAEAGLPQLRYRDDFVWPAEPDEEGSAP
jgi:hypothetical protein